MAQKLNFGVDLGQVMGLVNYLSGNTPQKKLDAFLDNEAPGLMQSINEAKTPEEVSQGAALFIMKALRAGVSPEQLDKLTDQLVEPALANLQAKDLQRLSESLEPGMEIVPRRRIARDESRDLDDPFTPTRSRGLSGFLGPGLSKEKLALPFEVRERPGRSVNQADLIRTLAPTVSRRGLAGLGTVLQTPSAVEENLAQAKSAEAAASTRMVERGLKERKLRSSEKLSELKPGDEGVSLEDVGLFPSVKPKSSLDVEEQKARTEASRALATSRRERKTGTQGMTGAQLIALRNSLIRQYQAAARAIEEAYSDEAEAEAAAVAQRLAEEIEELDREIDERRGRERPRSRAKVEATITGGKPTVRSVKKKFGLE